MKKTILVLGAAGEEAGRVARMLLRQRKYNVRVLTRDTYAEEARLLQRAGAELFSGDPEDEDSLLNALKGCYGVFGINGFRDATEMTNMLEWQHADIPNRRPAEKESQPGHGIEEWMVRNKFRIMDQVNARMGVFVI